jgi:ETC complex I subunit conserved region
MLASTRHPGWTLNNYHGTEGHAQTGSGVMRARIYQPPKNAMQSGRAATHEWVLEFEPSSPRRPDPLMGWIGSADTQAQVRLSFKTRDEAVAYAERNGIVYDLELAQPRHVRPKAYADNFRYGRIENWTH